MATPKVKILNIEIDNISQQELLESFDEGILVTPNVDHLIKLQHNNDFYQSYKEASYTVCDSRILFLLSKVIFPGNSIKHQITGSDFFPAFCEYHSNKQTKIFLLGGTEESSKAAQSIINKRTNSQVIVGTYSPPFGFEHSEAETSKIIDIINTSGATALAIGVGAPKQELWVCKNRCKLNSVKMFMAVGATIEFESGNLSRSPKWMTTVGLEWLYRLAQEPKRLGRRYLLEDLPIFLLILKQRIGLYRNPWQQ